MRVLVTNDDGVEALGIRALATALAAAGHDVVIVAPSDERSGAAAAIGLMHRSLPIPCRATAWADLPGVPVYAIDAPPATAVYAGCLGALGPRPDLVASGINRGANTGHLLLHSGTVGAALTAAALGIPALAVSLSFGEHLHYETAAAVASAALEWTATPSTPPRVVNINVPNVVLAALLGVWSTCPAPYQEVWEGSANDAEVLLQYKGRQGEAPEGTDVAALVAGYASVTLLQGLVGSPEARLAAAVEAALPLSVRS